MKFCKETCRVAGAKQRRASLQGGQLMQPRAPFEGFEFCPVEGGAVEGALLADK